MSNKTECPTNQFRYRPNHDRRTSTKIMRKCPSRHRKPPKDIKKGSNLWPCSHKFEQRPCLLTERDMTTSLIQKIENGRASATPTPKCDVITPDCKEIALNLNNNNNRHRRCRQVYMATRHDDKDRRGDRRDRRRDQEERERQRGRSRERKGEKKRSRSRKRPYKSPQSDSQRAVLVAAKPAPGAAAMASNPPPKEAEEVASVDDEAEESEEESDDSDIPAAPAASERPAPDERSRTPAPPVEPLKGGSQRPAEPATPPKSKSTDNASKEANANHADSAKADSAHDNKYATVQRPVCNKKVGGGMAGWWQYRRSPYHLTCWLFYNQKKASKNLGLLASRKPRLGVRSYGARGPQALPRAMRRHQSPDPERKKKGPRPRRP